MPMEIRGKDLQLAELVDLAARIATLELLPALDQGKVL